MTFKVYGTEYEGKTLYDLLSWMGGSYGAPDQCRYLKKYLEDGGKVYLEFTKGARKGTVGRLNLTPEMVMDYRKLEGGYYKDKWARNMKGVQLEFDDRKTTIPVDLNWYQPKKLDAVLRFTPSETVWVYTTTARPKEEIKPVFDHFGVEIKVGSVVLFMHGSGNTYHNRIGKVTRISAKHTIWVEAFRTREHHKAEEINTGVYAQDMFVLDGDIRDKAMMAKLAF